MSLAARVRDARRARGLSRADLAARAGCNHMSIRRWESGEAEPQLPQLHALCVALNVRCDDLLDLNVQQGDPTAVRSRPQARPVP